jgi:peptidyl-prolyl cis-trans isomerase C
MSDKKNNTPLIVGVVAVLAIIVGAIFYMTKDDSGAAPASVASSSNEAPVTSDASQPVSEGEAAAVAEQSADHPDLANAQGTIDGVEVKPGNPIVARVDGRAITRLDVFRFIKLMPANIQQLPAAAVYPLALDQVINTRVVQNKADEAGLEKDAEVQEQLELAKQQIMRSVYVQRQVDKQISESDLKKAYDELVTKVPDVEEVSASHILVKDEATARDLIAQLNGGADFAKLAAANSNDPGNKDQGGNLGWFSKQDMVPEFSDAAFKIEKGKLGAEPVQTQFGWHVIKVNDKRKRPKPSYDEVKPMLQVELRREKLETIVEGWRKAATVETFDVNGNPVAKADAPAPVETAPAANDNADAPAEAPPAEQPAAQ